MTLQYEKKKREDFGTGHAWHLQRGIIRLNLYCSTVDICGYLDLVVVLELLAHLRGPVRG